MKYFLNLNLELLTDVLYEAALHIDTRPHVHAICSKCSKIFFLMQLSNFTHLLLF